MQLTNRETAILLWLTALVILGLRKPSVRAPAIAIVRTLCQRAVLTVLGLAGIYIAACIKLLAWANVWTINNLKTTILWSLGFAFISIVNISKIEEDPAYFKTVLRETLSLIVL